MTASAATVARSEDDTEFRLNGTLPDSTHFSWFPGVDRHLIGVQDLKAPDVEHPGASFRFTNMAPSIPKNAVIISAALSGGAALPNLGNGALTIIVEVVEKDTLWDASPNSAAQWISGDHAIYKRDMGVVVRDGGAIILADTGVPLTGFNAGLLSIRRFGSPDRSTRMAQRVVITTAGTLATATVTLQKLGLPTGNIFLEVFDVAGGLPGSLLATSDNADVSTLLTAPGSEFSFTFSGGDAIALALSDDRFWSVGGDWAINGVDFVTARVGTTDYTSGYFATFGEGLGLDSQHYPMAQMPLDLPTVAGSVTWPTTVWAENSTQTTPDLAALIQTYVNAATYVEGDPFLVRLRRLSGAQKHNRGFKSFDSPDTPGLAQLVTLDIEWRRRHVGVI